MKKELSKILSDKHFTKDNVVTDREGMKNEEYSSLGAVVKTLCWSVQNRVGNQLEYINKQVSELRDMTESAFTGSDVQEDRLQRKLDFIENLQTSNDETLILQLKFDKHPLEHYPHPEQLLF